MAKKSGAKKTEKKEVNWKKILASVAIGFIVFLFVASIFIGWGAKGRLKTPVDYALKINGEKVHITVFQDTYSYLSSIYADYLSKFPPSQVKKILKDETTRRLVQIYLLKQFAEKQEIVIPDKILKDTLIYRLAYREGVSPYNIPKSVLLRKYDELKNESLAYSVQGDVETAVAFTYPELIYLYQIELYKAKVETAFLDYSKFFRKIVVKSKKKELDEFVATNRSDYAEKVEVILLTAKRKRFAQNVSDSLNSLKTKPTVEDVKKFVEKHIKMYPNAEPKIKIVVLRRSDTSKLNSKLFREAVSLEEGKTSKAIYFKRKYYVVSVVRHQKFDELAPETRDKIVSDFIDKNKDELLAEFLPSMNSVMEVVVDEVKKGRPMRVSAQRNKVDYYNLKPFSLLAVAFKDVRGKEVPFKPSPQFLLKVFTAKSGSVSKPIKLDSGIVVFKLQKKYKASEKFEETAYKLTLYGASLKNNAVKQDWFSFIRKGAVVESRVDEFYK